MGHVLARKWKERNMNKPVKHSQVTLREALPFAFVRV
jgi:hypothetical protein